MPENPSVVSELDKLFDSLQRLHADKSVPLKMEYEAQWNSACYQSEPDSDGFCIWKPVPVTQPLDLSAVERGLEIALRPEISEFFCSYWSDHITAKTARGGLVLLFAINEDDLIRLQENLIAHVLMKRRLGQQETLFFAQTDEEDLILSVLNNSGEVVLEPVGQEPQEILAPNLAEFLATIIPELHN